MFIAYFLRTYSFVSWATEILQYKKQLFHLHLHELKTEYSFNFTKCDCFIVIESIYVSAYIFTVTGLQWFNTQKPLTYFYRFLFDVY